MYVINTILIIFFSISLFTSIIHLFLYMKIRQMKEHLFFSLFCFSVALYDIFSFFLYNSSSLGEGIIYQRLIYSTSSLISISAFVFSHVLTNKKLNSFGKTIIIILLLTIFIPFIPCKLIFSTDNPNIRFVHLVNHKLTYYESRPGIIISLTIFFVIFSMFYCYILYLLFYIKQNNNKNTNIIIGFTAYFFAASMDNIFPLLAIKFIYTLEYSLFIMILILSYILAKSFVKIYNNNEIMNNRYNLLLKNTKEGFFVINKEYIIQNEYSAECENIFMQNITSIPVYNLIKEFKNIINSDIIDNIFNTKDNLIYINSLPKDIYINNKFINIRYQPIVELNRTEKIMFILTDMTEIKAMQKQSIERERLATLGELAGGVAHDVNNPAGAIEAGLTRIKKLYDKYENESDLQKRFELKEEIYKMIDVSHSACKKILKIVGTIKNHTRNLNGETKEVFLVKNVVDNVIIMIDHRIRKSKVTLKVSGNEKILIKGDPGKLSQVLTNFIVNSIEAYENKALERFIEINLSQVDKNSIISIKDQAGGISKEIDQKIFKNILTTKSAGTGLGLYISSGIITGHFKGTINYETQLGKGTTFYITIPWE